MEAARADGRVRSRRSRCRRRGWRGRTWRCAALATARDIHHDAGGRRRRDRFQRQIIAPAPAARAGRAQRARMPRSCTDCEVEPRRSVGLVILIVPPALNCAVFTQPARVPRARAHLREHARRRLTLSIVIHPPALHRATLPHPAGMRRPRAHLREDSLGRISPPKAAAPPASELARRPQSASVQVTGTNRSEFTLRWIRLSVIEDAAAEVASSPALDRAVALAHRAGEVPAGGDIGERAVRRVRVSAPAGDPAVLPSNRAVVPFPGADRTVAAFGDLK